MRDPANPSTGVIGLADCHAGTYDCYGSAQHLPGVELTAQGRLRQTANGRPFTGGAYVRCIHSASITPGRLPSCRGAFSLQPTNAFLGLLDVDLHSNSTPSASEESFWTLDHVAHYESNQRDFQPTPPAGTSHLHHQHAHPSPAAPFAAIRSWI